MNPNSRSPCAAWLRFMKSMSMVPHGISTWAWVCRCRSGLRSASRPWIHILAGENVCIQPTRPTHASSALASSTARRIASDEVRTGFHTTSGTTAWALPSSSATCRDCSATWASVSSPYRPWLPVRNQICVRAHACSFVGGVRVAGVPAASRPAYCP